MAVCPDAPERLIELLKLMDSASQLFIGFTPSAKGQRGQVVRFLHDPDELVIAADSFDAYLQMLMEQNYAFMDEDIDIKGFVFPA